MTDFGLVTLILLLTNFVFSYKGFTTVTFFENYKFDVDRILINKDYIRLISSGFLHVDWMHLIFNMMSLYAFSRILENELGGFYFLLVYLVSLLGGNLFALFVHRHHGDYTAVGASGAVCGVIFASIALFPGLGIGFFGLEISIPSWIFGILYVGYSIYGIKSGKDNIGHEAHLGGAIVGMLFALILRPSALFDNYLIILLIAVPTLLFIYLIVTKPHFLLLDTSLLKKEKKFYNIEHQYNDAKVNKQKELDKLLDKIKQKGIDSLSKKEKMKLEEYSK